VADVTGQLLVPQPSSVQEPPQGVIDEGELAGVQQAPLKQGVSAGQVPLSAQVLPPQPSSEQKPAQVFVQQAPL